MSDQLIKTGRHPVFLENELGCVSCGRRAHRSSLGLSPETVLVGDTRGRYWCLGCAEEALANVRRRVDHRESTFEYPWRFEDVGPTGEHVVPRAARLHAKRVLDKLEGSFPAGFMGALRLLLRV
jgi:hypothetical protein